MEDLAPQTDENVVENTAEKGAPEYKLERTIAGIPDAISGLVHKDGDEGDLQEDDPSKYRIERAVAGVPSALTFLKDKKLAEKAELQAAEGIVEEGEPEHKLEKTIIGIPDQIDDIEAEIAEHVMPVIEQTSADAKARSKEIGSGAVMILAAVIVAVFGIPVVLLGIAAALALVIPWWASLLIVGGALLVIAIICTYSAKGHFSKAGEYDVSLKAGIRKSFDYLFKGIGMPDDMAEGLRESDK